LRVPDAHTPATRVESRLKKWQAQKASEVRTTGNLFVAVQ